MKNQNKTIAWNTRVSRTAVHPIRSEEIGQDYELWIDLPEGYAGTEAKYPILYLLDAIGSFGLVADCARIMHYEGRIPPIVVAGIAYSVENYVASRGIRARDFTPTIDPAFLNAEDLSDPDFWRGVQFGGASEFLKFLGSEILPYIESRYRVRTDDRALLGISFGGLFATYVMFHQTELFQRYMLCSPGIDYHDWICLSYEEAYAANHRDLPAHVFLSAGEEEPETVTGNQRLTEALNGRDYPSLKLSTHVYTEETHVSVIPIAVSRGLREIYATSLNR
jgi:predicted alpha/beta superfamily hydrolase